MSRFNLKGAGGADGSGGADGLPGPDERRFMGLPTDGRHSGASTNPAPEDARDAMPSIASDEDAGGPGIYDEALPCAKISGTYDGTPSYGTDEPEGPPIKAAPACSNSSSFTTTHTVNTGSLLKTILQSSTAGCFEVLITQDINLPTLVIMPAVAANAGRTVWIHSSPASPPFTIWRENSMLTKPMIEIGANQKVILTDIIFDGRIYNSWNANSGGAIIHIKPDGELDFRENTIFQYNRNTDYNNDLIAGAIYNETATLKISGGQIFGCTSNNNRSGSCGAILNTGNFEMTGGSIHDNTNIGSQIRTSGAVLNGGLGTFKMYGGSITGNTNTSSSTESSGAIFNQSIVYLYGGTISGNINNSTGNNKASAVMNMLPTSGTAIGTVYMSGGEIYDNTIGSFAGNNSAAVFNTGTFNMSGGRIGGTDYPASYPSGPTGMNNSTGSFGAGGVYNGGTFSMSGTALIQYNVCKITGSNSVSAGGVCNNAGTFSMSNTALIQYNINNSTGSVGAGGVYNSATFNMSNTALIQYNQTNVNNARNGGGVYNTRIFNLLAGEIRHHTLTKSSSSATDGNGAGVYSTSATANFTMSGGSIDNNTASGDGGGFYNVNGATFSMSAGNIHDNAASNGAGVYSTGANTRFTMSGGSVYNNINSVSGGGLYSSSGATFTMSGGSIHDNTASSNGAGVYSSGASASLTAPGGSIYHNTASGDGGGFYNYSSATLTMSAGSIHDNIAANNGGGLYNGGGATFTMSGGLIGGTMDGDGNSAERNGGGIYNDSTSTCTITSGTIDYNTAGISGINNGGGNGGGIYCLNTLTIANATICHNKALSGAGGGVYAANIFNMANGTICHNWAEGNGGGILIDRPNGVLTITGTVDFNYNEALNGGAICVCRENCTAQFLIGTGISGISASSSFSGNYAREGGWKIDPNDKVASNAVVLTHVVSAPFDQLDLSERFAYNNFDICYRSDYKLQAVRVRFANLPDSLKNCVEETFTQPAGYLEKEPEIYENCLPPGVCSCGWYMDDCNNVPLITGSGGTKFKDGDDLYACFRCTDPAMCYTDGECVSMVGGPGCGTRGTRGQRGMTDEQLQTFIFRVLKKRLRELCAIYNEAERRR